MIDIECGGRMVGLTALPPLRWSHAAAATWLRSLASHWTLAESKDVQLDATALPSPQDCGGLEF